MVISLGVKDAVDRYRADKAAAVKASQQERRETRKQAASDAP